MRYVTIGNLHLKEYSLLASALLSGLKGYSDIVYTNPEPDGVLEFNDDVAYIDMDASGTVDVEFHVGRAFCATEYYQTIYSVNFNLQIPNTMYNRVAGSFFTIGDVMYSSFQTYRPYAIPVNYLIGPVLSFQDNHWQLLAYLQEDLDGNLLDAAGKWYPQQEEQFIGLHFTSVDGLRHYGWIRCTMVDTLQKFIIHDFAYEDIPELPIRTGQTSGTLVSIHDLKSSAEVFAANNTIYINLNTEQLSDDHRVDIYDISGARIHTEMLNTPNTEIHLNAPTGTYLVTISNQHTQFTRNIILM